MGNKFEDILHECIERVVMQGEPLQQCLASYPQQRAELEPLLRVALAAAQASAIEPRPEFKAALAYRATSVVPQQPQRSWRLRWMGALAGLMAVFLMGAGAIAASGSSLPGEPLYTVKLATERTQLWLAGSEESKAQLHIAFSERRVQEIVRMVRRGETQGVSGLMDRLNQHLRLATAVPGVEAGEFQGRLVQSSTQQLSLLEAALKVVPEAAKPALKQALTASGEAYGEAIETVTRRAPATAPVAVVAGTIQIRAADPPPPQVDQVLVEVANIQVRQAGKDGQWITVVSEPVTFDLIRVAEVQKFLGSLPVDPGTYTQIRLEITKATVVVGGQEYPVQVPDGKLKLVRPFQVREGETTVVLLDFDGDRSLIMLGFGESEEFRLTPVVMLLVPEAEEEGESGSDGKKTKVDIEGTIESVTQTDSGTVVVVKGMEVVLPPGTGIAGILKAGMDIEVETVVQPDGSFSVMEVEAEGEEGTKVELKEGELEIEQGTIDTVLKNGAGAVVGVIVDGVQVDIGPGTEVKGTLTEGAVVELEALQQPDGSFLATEIKVKGGEEEAEEAAEEEAEQAEEAAEEEAEQAEEAAEEEAEQAEEAAEEEAEQAEEAAEEEAEQAGEAAEEEAEGAREATEEEAEQAGEDTKLLLWEKDPSDWSIVVGGALGELEFSLAGPTFVFDFEATGLLPDTDYSLIYHADPLPGDNPGALVASGTTDDEGKLKLNGSVDLGMDLPAPADANYPGGAKIWLVLSSDYDASTNKMVEWNPTEYLFENNLITYDDTDV